MKWTYEGQTNEGVFKYTFSLEDTEATGFKAFLEQTFGFEGISMFKFNADDMKIVVNGIWERAFKCTLSGLDTRLVDLEEYMVSNFGCEELMITEFQLYQDTLIIRSLTKFY